jgi:hypothetical protein
MGPLGFVSAYRAAEGEQPDVVALNPYMEGLLPVYAPREHLANGAITLRNLDQLENALRAWTGRTVPIWLTEFAWRTAPTPRLRIITLPQQAQLLRQSVALVRDREQYVQMLVWFLVRDETPTSYWRSGLVLFNWRHKPAFAVYRQLARASN